MAKPRLFDVIIFGVLKAKVRNVPASSMKEAAEKATESYDFNALNQNFEGAKDSAAAVSDPHVAYVEAADEDSYFAVEPAGNREKKVPDPLTLFAPASGDESLLEIPFSEGPRTKLGDFYKLVQSIAAIKTEEEQDDDGDGFTNDEHVSNMNRIIEEAREMLGRTEKGKEVIW
jgi:hypothetical protein